MDPNTEQQLLNTLSNINSHLANITRNSGNRSYGNNHGGYYPSYSSGYYGNYSENKELRPSADKPGFSRSDMLYKKDFKYDEHYDSTGRQKSERTNNSIKEIVGTVNTKGLNDKIKDAEKHINNLNDQLTNNANLTEVERGVITQRIKTLEDLKKDDEELKKANEEIIKASNNYYKNLDDSGAKMRLTTAIFEKNFLEYSNKMWKSMEESGESLLYTSKESWKEMQKLIMKLDEEQGKYISNMQSALSQTGLTNKGPGKVLSKYLDRKQKGLDMQKGGERMKKAAEQFGNAVGSKGAAKIMKNFGAIAQKAGSMLSKMAGPITIIIEILSFIDKAAAKVMETMAEMNELKASDIQNQTEINMMQNKVTVEAIQKNWELSQHAVSNAGSITLQQIQANSKIMNDAARLVASNYAKSAEIFTGSLFDGISKTANQAARYAIEATADVAKFNIEAPTARIKAGRMQSLKNLEFATEKANVLQQFEMTKFQAGVDVVNKAFEMQEKLAESGLAGMLYNGNEASNIVGGNFAGNKQVDLEKTLANASKNFGLGNTQSSVAWAQGLTVANDAMNTLFGFTSNAAEAGKKLALSDMKVGKSIFNSAMQGIFADMQIKAANDIGMRNFALEQKRQEVEIKNAKLDAVNEVKKTYIDSAKEILLKWQQIGENFENMMQEHNKLAIDAGIDIGYTNARQNSLDFHNYYMGMQRDVTWKWGKEAKDALKLQGEYTSESGRNRALSYGDTDSLMAANKLLGDEGTAVQFASSAEIFNKGIGKSVDLMSTMYNKVSRMGLNGRKYTKEILKNIQMANKYNFRDGLEGMMRTAAWAMKTRFEMSSLGRMTDKIIDNGLEGVIKQSAQLQVLGGMAAINSDPLGMLYDALADPEALAKRMHGMTENFGSIDRKTGETTFGAAEELQIRAIAQAQGRDPGELRNEIRARNRAQAVKNQTRFSTNLSQEQIDFLAANAQWDEKSQGFTAQVWGKDENGKWGYQQKNVSEITAEMIDKIRPEEHQAVVEEQLFAIRSALEMETGESAQERADIATATYAKYIENVQARVTEAHNNYLAKRDEYIKNVEESMARATESFTNYIDMWNKGNSEVDTQIKNLKVQVGNINSALDGVAAAGASAASALASLPEKLGGFVKLLNDKINNIEYKNSGDEGKNSPAELFFKELTKYHGATDDFRVGYKSLKDAKKTRNGHYDSHIYEIVDDIMSNNRGFFNQGSDLNDTGILALTLGSEFSNKDFDDLDLSQKDKVVDMITSSIQKHPGLIKNLLGETGDTGRVERYFEGLRKKNTSKPKEGTLLSKVAKANDAIISPGMQVKSINDGIVQTHPNDTLLAAKPGGGFDKLFSSILPDISNIGRYVASTMNGNTGGNSTFTINGSIKLTSDSGNSIDIIPMLKNNPDMLRQLVNILISGSDIYHNGGKTNEFLRI